jgi:hypothetical protein
MLPAEPRLPEVRPLIDKELNFVLHAPRQSGKTTCFQVLAGTLTAEGRFAAVHASCERGQAAGSDVERGVQAILRTAGNCGFTRSKKQRRQLRAGAVEHVVGLCDVSNRAGLFALSFILHLSRTLVITSLQAGIRST